jgi:hypothetical protein
VCISQLSFQLPTAITSDRIGIEVTVMTLYTIP